IVTVPGGMLLGAGAGSLIGQTLCSIGNNPDAQSDTKPAIPDVGPKDLCEQLALNEAKGGAGRIIMWSLGDEARLLALYGSGPWVKKQHIHKCFDGRTLIIHYFHSVSTGRNVELKFVN